MTNDSLPTRPSPWLELLEEEVLDSHTGRAWGIGRKLIEVRDQTPGGFVL